MATKPLTTEIDLMTNTVVEREMTADEVANEKKLNSEATTRAAAIEAQVAARESALAKLADLGLTAEEIAAL